MQGGDILDDNVKGRIKEVRLYLKASQPDFASKLGIPFRTYFAYERGERPIPERLIVSISAVHGVNEDWLRTGEGEMFPPKTPDEEFGELIGGLLADEPESFRRKLVTNICKLSDDQIEAVRQFMRTLFEDHDNEKK